MDNDEPENNIMDWKKGDKIEIKNRKSSSVITKYELVIALSIRAEQIAEGAPVMVQGIDFRTKTPLQLAHEEILCKSSPIKIRRPITPNSYEEFSINELKIYNSLFTSFTL